ncbi:hypothetical protein ACWAT4_19350 [Bradyrhizobium manausense]
MTVAVLPRYADRFRLHPVERRYASMFCFALFAATPVWLVGLVAACEIARPFGRGRATA